MSIEQILDTIDTSTLHNFDRTNFLIYANYMFATIKSKPPNVKCEDYYYALYKYIAKFYIRSSL